MRPGMETGFEIPVGCSDRVFDTKFGFVNPWDHPEGKCIGFKMADSGGPVPGETSSNLCYQLTIHDVAMKKL